MPFHRGGKLRLGRAQFKVHSFQPEVFPVEDFFYTSLDMMLKLEHQRIHTAAQ